MVVPVKIFRYTDVIVYVGSTFSRHILVHSLGVSCNVLMQHTANGCTNGNVILCGTEWPGHPTDAIWWGEVIVDLLLTLRPSEAYIHQLIMPSLVQSMACRLLDTKPLSEPMLVYCHLHPQEQISVKFETKLKHFDYVSLSRCLSMWNLPTFDLCGTPLIIRIALFYSTNLLKWVLFVLTHTCMQ